MGNRHVLIIGDAQDAAERARTIEVVVFDGDGVLTNNQVLEGLIDVKPRYRSHYDGQGISLLRAIGVRVCFVTNESGESARAISGLVERWNSLPSTPSWGRVGLFLDSGGDKKIQAAEQWFVEQGLRGWESCAVMGDDLVDVPMIRMAYLKVAPCTAEYAVKDLVDIISRRPAGSGAIRDFANFVLESRGIDQTKLPTQ